MKRDIEDIIKDIDNVDSMKKVNELLDALAKRKEDLMCNDVKLLALVYAKMLNIRRDEFEIIQSISSILGKYVNGDDIRNITDNDWNTLKEVLFPKVPDAYKPIITDEEFDRLYPGDSRHITMTKEMMEADPFYQMLKISLEDKNDTTSIPTSSH